MIVRQSYFMRGALRSNTVISRVSRPASTSFVLQSIIGFLLKQVFIWERGLFCHEMVLI